MQRLSRIIGVATLVVMATAGPAMAKGHQPFHTLHVDESVLALEGGTSDPIDCPPGAGWRFSSSGTSQMHHLGRFEMHLTQCTFPDDEGGFSEGTTTFRAANGDLLVLAHDFTWTLIFDGPGPPDGFEGSGEWSVDHGTGRFASASGSGSVHALGDIPSDHAVGDLPEGATLWAFEGDVEYRASDRSDR